MSLKNPVRPIADSTANKKKLRILTEKEWEGFSDAMKLSRIALCEELKDFSLINIKYDRDEIIKRYNRRKNKSQDLIEEEHTKTINKYDEKIITLQENIKSQEENYKNLYAEAKEIKAENKKLVKENKSLEDQCTEQNNTIENLRANLEKSKNKIRELKDKIEHLESQSTKEFSPKTKQENQKPRITSESKSKKPNIKTQNSQ